MLETLTDLLDSAVDEPREFAELRDTVRLLFNERLPAADILSVAPLLTQRTALPPLIEKLSSGTISRSDLNAYVRARPWPQPLSSAVLALDKLALSRLARALDTDDWVLAKAILWPPTSA